MPLIRANNKRGGREDNPKGKLTCTSSFLQLNGLSRRPLLPGRLEGAILDLFPPLLHKVAQHSYGQIPVDDLQQQNLP